MIREEVKREHQSGKRGERRRDRRGKGGRGEGKWGKKRGEEKIEGER